MFVQNLLKNPWKLYKSCPIRCLCTRFFTRNNIVCLKSSKRCRNKKLNSLPYLWTVPNLEFHSSARSFDEKKLPVEDPSQPMKKITFVLRNGEEIEVKGRAGLTVMQEAVRNNLPMEASCEGHLACTTCHLYVEDCVRNDSGTENPYLGVRDIIEEDLLDVAVFCRPNSRLSCQLIISKDCENARFRFPAATCNISVGEQKKDRN